MKLASIKEVSELLKVKQSTIYSWVHNGTIPFFKLNGLLRFDLGEIIEWVKNSKAVPCNVTVPSGKSRNLDIDRIVKKAIEGVKGKGYNSLKRETSPSQGLKKEV